MRRAGKTDGIEGKRVLVSAGGGGIGRVIAIATTDEIDRAIVHGPGLRWALMGTCLTFHLAGGEGGMAHMLAQFGPALKLPWSKLEAPDLTPTLIERLIEGTEAQVAGRSVRELERYRDDCLIAIMKAIEETRKAHA